MVLYSKYFFYQICQKFVDLFTNNMNGWSHIKIILYLFCSFELLRKKVEFFLCGQPFCVQIFPKYFFLNFTIKNICCCLSKSLFNWSSHFFTSFRKPAGNPTDSFKYYTAAIMSFNSYPNIW